MANPTLLGNATPYAGFTLSQIVERLLATRGMTEDSTNTGRTPATTQDSTDARERVRRAFVFLAEAFPSIWSMRTYATTWPVAGEHSIVLPAGATRLSYVTFGGRALDPISQDDYLRLLEADDAGGGVQSGSEVLWYQVTGVADELPLGNHDWRPVLRLFATPAAVAENLVLGYLAKAPELAVGENLKALPIENLFQEWVLARAREVWGTDEGDLGMSEAAQRARLGPRLDGRGGIEKEIRHALSGTQQNTRRASWRLPRAPGFVRGE